MTDQRLKIEEAHRILLDAARAPGWDRRTEIAALTVLGAGDVERGRSTVVEQALRMMDLAGAITPISKT